MTVLPFFSVLMTPLEETVATEGFEEIHLTFCVVLPASSLSLCFLPFSIVSFIFFIFGVAASASIIFVPGEFAQNSGTIKTHVKTSRITVNSFFRFFISAFPPPFAAPPRDRDLKNTGVTLCCFSVQHPRSETGLTEK